MSRKKAEYYCCEDASSRCRDGMQDIYEPFIWKFEGNMTDKEAANRGFFVCGLIRGTELYHAYSKIPLIVKP